MERRQDVRVRVERALAEYKSEASQLGLSLSDVLPSKSDGEWTVALDAPIELSGDWSVYELVGKIDATANELPGAVLNVTINWRKPCDTMPRAPQQRELAVAEPPAKPYA